MPFHDILQSLSPDPREARAVSTGATAPAAPPSQPSAAEDSAAPGAKLQAAKAWKNAWCAAPRPDRLLARVGSQGLAGELLQVPEHRVVVDCLPKLLSCEKRLEARLQGRPGSIGWCHEAIQAAPPGFDPPRLKPPRREKTGKRSGWFGRRL